jgi:glyoxylase-like metal-dependent hydrolase (beta-lactamase superfamily II)
VWVPGVKALLSGDTILRGFPTLYSPRGMGARPVTGWVASLDLVRNMYPEFLVPSHTKPLTGKAQVSIVVLGVFVFT